MSLLHVIVLAQGEQRRLFDLPVRKQLLRLPHCGNYTIIDRTLEQVMMICERSATYSVAITVVTWPDVAEHVRAAFDMDLTTTPTGIGLGTHTLPDPGNSSLKGVGRYLWPAHDALTAAPDDTDWTRRTILLGDTVYSWECLRWLLEPPPSDRDPLFVCTRDLSPSGGELWGITYSKNSRQTMAAAHEDAMAKHPPYAEYQPGQLRNWLWALQSFVKSGPVLKSKHVAFVDDYTRDIDTPEHVERLPRISEFARSDDANNGVVW